MSLLTRYDALLRGTGAGPALTASLLGRMSLGTTGLALLLLVRASSGSYAAAGAVAAAYAVAFAAFAPARARSADRRGPRPVLVACSLLHPLVLVGLVLLRDAPVPVLLLSAVAAGATVPPLGGVMRALWATLADADPRVDLATAYSLESVLIEICFVGGPLLVAALQSFGPPAAVLAAAVLVLVGGLGLAASPAVGRVVPHPTAVRGRGGPLRSPGVRALLGTVFAMGAGFGCLDVAVVAFAEDHSGSRSTGAVLLAVWSAGSILGGLVYGAVHSDRPHARQLPWLVGALGVGSALPVLAPGTVSMGVLLVLYGSTIAPYSACSSVLLGRAAPAGTLTEAFAWSSSAIFGGAALGNVVSGSVVEHGGVRLALALPAVTGLLGVLATLSARHALASPARTV